MASLEAFSAAKAYGPKLLAVLSPWAYATWKRARKKPILWINRGPKAVQIINRERDAITNVSLQLSSASPLSASSVTTNAKDFSELKVTETTEGWLRVRATRLSEFDVIEVEHPGELTIDVIESDAVPVAGQPLRHLRAIDTVVSLFCLSLFVLLVLGPVQDFLIAGNQQSQDNSNTAMAQLIESVAEGLVVTSLVLWVTAAFVPARIASIRNRRHLVVAPRSQE